jgi:hypothetical protein
VHVTATINWTLPFAQRRNETANFKLVEKLMTSTGFGIFLHSSWGKTDNTD